MLGTWLLVTMAYPAVLAQKSPQAAQLAQRSAPPLAQGAILETQDRIPHRDPGAWSLRLPLPVSLPLSLSLSLCDYHK